MVGRQTSRGCSTCRQRKIRCDLVNPACSACVKGGWLCPGYADRFIVVADQSHKGSKKPVKVRKAGCTPTFTHDSVPAGLISQADSLRAEFLSKLEGDVLAARLAMMPASHVLRHLPKRIGRNNALDDAVRCITYGPHALPIHQRSLESGALMYGQALRSLREAIEDPILRNLPETLAAASVLQMYEQYADFPSRTWIHHARGVIKMLKVRGPSNITDEIERAILEAQAGNTFMSALANNEDCFMSNPTWYQVLRPTPALDGHLDRFMRMIVDGERFPGLERLCEELVRKCQFDDDTPLYHRQRVTNIAVQQMMKMRKQFKHQLDAGPGFKEEKGLAEPVLTAAYAATGFFLIIINTILMGVYEQNERLCGGLAMTLPDGVTPEQLKAERLDTLHLCTARFKALGVMQPSMRHTAPAALRVILGTIFGLGKPTLGEEETLLLVLDQELTLENTQCQYAINTVSKGSTILALACDHLEEVSPNLDAKAWPVQFE
jgi:hypothetical protein